MSGFLAGRLSLGAGNIWRLAHALAVGAGGGLEPFLVLSARTPTCDLSIWRLGFLTACWRGSKGKHPSQERMEEGENQAAAGDFMT